MDLNVPDFLKIPNGEKPELMTLKEAYIKQFGSLDFTVTALDDPEKEADILKECLRTGRRYYDVEGVEMPTDYSTLFSPQ